MFMGVNFYTLKEKAMAGKGWVCCIGCIAAGAVGAVLYMKHKDKVKPMAAKLMAKGLQLKEKALTCAAKAKEHTEDVIAEAKLINESSAEA